MGAPKQLQEALDLAWDALPADVSGNVHTTDDQDEAVVQALRPMPNADLSRALIALLLVRGLGMEVQLDRGSFR